MVAESISFKKLSREDIPLLLDWFSNPHVSKWWPVLEKNEATDHFLQRIRSKDTFGYIIYMSEKPIGYIQYYYIDHRGEKTGKYFPKLPPHSIGTDQFIGEPEFIGKGIGKQMIKRFIDYLQKVEPDVATVIVDPEPANEIAIRCYEKVGFKKVGVYKNPHGSYLVMRYDLDKNK